jgi:hypothetical protein
LPASGAAAYDFSHTFSAPQKLGIKGDWDYGAGGLRCALASTCVGAMWAGTDRLVEPTYWTEAVRFSSVKKAKRVFAQQVARRNRVGRALDTGSLCWMCYDVHSAGGRNARAATWFGPGQSTTPTLGAIARVGKRVVEVQLTYVNYSSKHGLPKGAALNVLRREALRVARPSGGYIPKGNPL